MIFQYNFKKNAAKDKQIMNDSFTQINVQDIIPNQSLFKVFQFAEQAHKGQLRLGLTADAKNIPYIVHPLQTMSIVANALSTNPIKAIQQEHNLPILAAALCHDVIEDTAYNSEQKLFNALSQFLDPITTKRIVRIVQELSNPPEGFPGNTKIERDLNKKNWQTKHVETISFEAKIVKMADQIANTISCADTFMFQKSNNEQYITVWHTSKLKRNIQKSLDVSSHCLFGMEKLPQEQRTIFAYLQKLQKHTYHYAMKKVEMPSCYPFSYFEQKKQPYPAFQLGVNVFFKNLPTITINFNRQHQRN